MGCIYCGYKANRRKNGSLKIGMTASKTPAARFSRCGLTPLWYLEIPHATKTELLFLESVARLAGENAGLKLCGNDYFDYIIKYPTKEERYHEACAISHPILKCVAKACEGLHLKYKLK